MTTQRTDNLGLPLLDDNDLDSFYAAWVDLLTRVNNSRATTAEALAAQKAQNLADLPSPPTARTNLGLGASATHPATDFLGATAQAVDSAKINGIAVTGTPSAGQVPVATSTSAATWQNLQITGQYLGSASTFGALPTTDASGQPAGNGDYAMLTADVVGAGTSANPPSRHGRPLSRSTYRQT